MYKTETKTHMHPKIKSYESLKGEKNKSKNCLSEKPHSKLTRQKFFFTLMVLIDVKKDMNEIKKNDKQKYQCERKKT